MALIGAIPRRMSDGCEPAIPWIRSERGGAGTACSAASRNCHRRGIPVTEKPENPCKCLRRQAQSPPVNPLEIGPIEGLLSLPDQYGDRTSETDPEGDKRTFAYNADSQETSTTSPRGNAEGAEPAKYTTTIERDQEGRPVKITDPLGHKTTKTYDRAGNLLTLTDAAGHTATYTYDADNRLTKVTYSDGKTPSVEYEYDAEGNRTKMVDGSGTSTYEYDQLDRLTKSTDGHGETVSYEYELAGRPTKITYPNAKSVTRTYDKVGRLSSVTDWLGGTSTFSYDPDSDLTAITFPEGTGEQDRYAYNAADQQTAATIAKGSETLAQLAYTRDSNGQLTAESSHGLPGAETTEYAYNEAEQLTRAGSTGYEYDAAGNLTKLGSSAQSFNEANELTASGGTTYAYGPDGERTEAKPEAGKGPATTYGYDEAGNMVSVSRAAEGSTPKIEDSYAYNGDGLRSSETVSGQTSYLTWDTAEALPLLLSNGTSSFVYGPQNLPIEQVNSSTGAVEYLHHDQQGSTRLLTNGAGEAVGKCSYAAYGSPSCEGSATTPLGYDGQYTEAETGLQYLRAREYEPGTGQFVSVDPLIRYTRAPYSYALGNPVTYWDPTGLFLGIPFTPSTGEVVHDISESVEEGVEEGVHFVGHVLSEHYGQLAEAGALGLCVATEVGAIPCLVATGTGFIASTVQNVTSPGGFSPATEALDALGTLPGLQVTGADLIGLLGDSSGATVAKIFTALIAAGAISGEEPIAEAAAALGCR
jgi:RHS repeat-associated protein